jgi:hypothetical protein
MTLFAVLLIASTAMAQAAPIRTPEDVRPGMSGADAVAGLEAGCPNCTFRGDGKTVLVVEGLAPAYGEARSTVTLTVKDSRIVAVKTVYVTDNRRAANAVFDGLVTRRDAAKWPSRDVTDAAGLARCLRGTFGNNPTEICNYFSADATLQPVAVLESLPEAAPPP